MSTFRTLAALSAVAVMAASGLAQDSTPTAPKAPAKPARSETPAAKLGVGDPAPAIAIAEWVKGEPVTSFEKGNVYVVEFWATWCPPCRKSIPHLTELQKQYKDKGVHIIGVTSEDPNNSLEAVKDMVKDYGPRMDYHVAFDDGLKTTNAYMRAARQNGIPTAFVVDKEGKIAWIGNPIYPEGEIDKVIGYVVEGKWNDAARAELANAAKAEAELRQSLGKAFGSQDPAQIVPAVKQAIALKGNDPNIMNEIAWMLVDPEGPYAAKIKADPALLEVALKAAEKADEATKHSNPPIIDTLARAYFVKGDKAKAIELQKLAVEKAPDTEKADYQKSLDEYMQ